MQIKELVLHEWEKGEVIAPLPKVKDGVVDRVFLIAFEFQNVEDARDVVDAVAKAVQSCK